MHPARVLRCFFGNGPFVEHVPLGLVEHLGHFRCAGVRAQFQAMTARVEEIDGLEDGVIGWT